MSKKSKLRNSKFETIISISIFVLSLLYSGCKPTVEVTQPEKIEPLPKEKTPDIIFGAASLNFLNYKLKVEDKFLYELGDGLKREEVEIFASQGVNHYAYARKTGVNIIEIIGKASGMNPWFGPTRDESGRQIGNTVFSALPHITFLNTEYQINVISDWKNIHNSYSGLPFIICGNICSNIYYLPSENLVLMDTKIVETEFGKLTISKFGLLNIVIVKK